MRHPKSGGALAGALVLWVAALSAVGGPGAAAAGVRYEPPGAGFSVVFPAAPEKQSGTEGFGAFALNFTAYGVDHGGMGYFVFWFGDMPEEAVRNPNIDEIFYTQLEQEFTLRGKVGSKGEISVAARSDVVLGRFHGRQLVFNSPVAMGVVRGYRVGRRFYAVGVLGNKAGYSAQRAVAFIESFQLTGKKK